MHISKCFLCLIVGGLTACVSTDNHNRSSHAAALHEKHIGGHLYRAGRHIHHHPEWQTQSPKNNGE